MARASEKINVSSPSISAAISQLEREFGIQFFIRQHAHGLSLTPGGRQFLFRARLLMDQADALHDLASNIADKPRGPIAIGCLSTVSPLVLVAIRRSFEHSCPEARVSQADAHQARLLEMLRYAEIDIAIIYDLALADDIAFEPLASLPLHVLIAANHRFAPRDSLMLEELVKEPMVLLDMPMSREYFLSIFQIRDLRPKIAERASDISMLRSLVANDYGYALLNIRPKLDRAPDGSPLAMVPLGGDCQPMALGLATIRSDREMRIVGAFREHCRAEIREGVIPGMTSLP